MVIISILLRPGSGRTDENMSMPISLIPRVFYRVAYQRFEEAEVLFGTGYYNGAVYLAGYAVECILKTLILNTAAEKEQKTIEAEFRGQKSHQYEWLKSRYASMNTPIIPSKINRSFVFVGTWETSLRYTPGTGKRHDAVLFFTAVRTILDWANRRI